MYAAAAGLQQFPAGFEIWWQYAPDSESSSSSSGMLPTKDHSSGRSTDGAPRPRRILIVDDEHLIADTLSRILNLNGFVARAAYSGDSALEIIPELCPDVVLTDVRMPGRNGVEVGRLIRAQCPETRVVLFSGEAGVRNLMSGSGKDGLDFELWPKPIHPRELVERLKKL